MNQEPDTIFVGTHNEYSIPTYKNSKWTCHLFGGVPGRCITWVPQEGSEPNWFWRKMQYLIFGNKWVKND